MRSGRTVTLAVLVAARLAAPALAAPAGSGPTTVVVCAPGYPGSTAEAASAMDAFAAALAAAAGLPRGALAAEYHETEAGGMDRLASPDAGVLLAPLPFFLEHEAALRLAARAQAVTAEHEATEQYALVARKGKLAGPSALDGWEILGTVGLCAAVRARPGARGLGRAAGDDEDLVLGIGPLRAAPLGGGPEGRGAPRSRAGERAREPPRRGELEVVTRSAALPAARRGDGRRPRVRSARGGGHEGPARARLAPRRRRGPREPAPRPLRAARRRGARDGAPRLGRRAREAVRCAVPRAAAGAALVLLLAGCAPALREPPPVTRMDAGAGPAPTAAAQDVDALLGEGESRFARRPDPPRSAPRSARSSPRPGPTRRGSRDSSASPEPRAG